LTLSARRALLRALREAATQMGKTRYHMNPKQNHQGVIVIVRRRT